LIPAPFISICKRLLNSQGGGWFANARQQRVSQCAGTSHARTERNVFVQQGQGIALLIFSVRLTALAAKQVAVNDQRHVLGWSHATSKS
jgi:hypothetical protein